MHHKVKTFYISGSVCSDNFIATRERLIKQVEDDMREEGYVPLLDLIPQFTRSYNQETEDFSFELSIVGGFVGEESAWQIAGLTDGKPVEKSTRRIK